MQKRFALVFAAPLLLLAAAAWLLVPGAADVRLALERGPAFAPSLGRRTGALTANFTAELGPRTQRLEYRVGEGAWVPVDLSAPTLDRGLVTLQLPADELRAQNRLEWRSCGWIGQWQHGQHAFGYDDALPQLPRRWSAADTGLVLESDHGHWIRTQHEGHPIVVPRADTEGYDRILLLCAALPGARRVRARILYLDGSLPHPGMLHGYGLIPLWGGNVDDAGTCPRRGWRYGLAWYYSAKDGFGIEFSTKEGAGAHDTIGEYVAAEPAPGRIEHVLVEAWPAGADGRFAGWRVRAKRWFEGEEIPAAWHEFGDEGGRRLPEGEYAVAFLAHRCSAAILDAVIERCEPPAPR